MSNTFLASLREKRESKTSLIQATLDRAAEEARDLSEVELANVEALNLEIKKLDERIEQMSDIEIRNQKAADLAARVDANVEPKKEVRAGGFTVTREELTYSERSGNDFLTDALKANFKTDADAAQRIARHQQEMAIEKRAVGTSNFAG
ncbi:MAG: hypothetical protein EBS18_06665, partial [Actinobacteria bacterium]|nr:hypothetical protein [Actinomycetota bacterium]